MQAIIPNSLPVSAPLTIEGAPVTFEEEGGLRDEDEPLLATLPPGWNPNPAPAQVSTQAATPVSPTSPPGFQGLPLLLLGLIALSLLGVFAAIRPRASGVR